MVGFDALGRRGHKESEGVLGIPSRGRVNRPPMHSTKTAYERRRQEALRYHGGGALEHRFVARVQRKIEAQKSGAIEAALFEKPGVGPPPKGERVVGGKVGLGRDHYATHMDSSRAYAAFCWTDKAEDHVPAPRDGGPVRKTELTGTAIGPESAKLHKGRGKKFVLDQLAGTKAALETGWHTGVTKHWPSASDDVKPASTAEKMSLRVSTATEPTVTALTRGKGKKFVREQLAGTGAALEVGWHSGVAKHWMPEAEYERRKPHPDGSPEAARDAAKRMGAMSEPRRAEYHKRELLGEGVVAELPGRGVSGPSMPEGRPAVINPRDLSMRDAEAMASGRPRSHWETESRALFGGHKAGFRNPVQAALPKRTGRLSSARAHADRFKSTALW